MQKEMKEISLNCDQSLFKIVTSMWKKVKKIFKLRLRHCTFPVLNSSDMIRVMRDLGLIQSAKNCKEFAEKIWESCLVYVDPEAAHAAPVDTHGRDYRP
jgi:hypothetical protein